jgi:hypothetical protein
LQQSASSSKQIKKLLRSFVSAERPEPTAYTASHDYAKIVFHKVKQFFILVIFCLMFIGQKRLPVNFSLLSKDKLILGKQKVKNQKKGF